MSSLSSNKEDLQGGYQSARSPSLENQIEMMLDNIMDGDNEEGNLRFSDDENSFDNKIEKDNLKDNSRSNSFFNSALFLNGSISSEEQDKNEHFHRMNKKFQTISFNNNNQSTNGYNNSNLMIQQMQYNNMLLQRQLAMQYNSQFKRSDIRKKTYDIKKAQKKFKTNSSNSTNSVTSFNSLNSTSAFSSQMQKMNHNETKRCSTMLCPQGTNMQIEILLYELTTMLSKTEKIDYFIYNKLQGNFINVIKTHKGSRIFQNYMKNTHSDIIHQIFIEINPFLSELISDSYANYFCKRFFSYLNQKDRVDFLKGIQNSLVALSMDNIGTYPVQGIIEQIGSKTERKIIIQAVQPSISELCFNTYGTHVLEKILSCFEDEFTSFIYDYVLKNFLSLAYNINGICIVKKVLMLTHKKDIHERLKVLSIENAIGLIQHSYGNYVIQIIVENWEESEVIDVVSHFEGNFVYLSMQKYSSNVVERCIEKTEKILQKYIREVCESERLAEIMKNNYGNYVIQKALRISKGNENALLVSSVYNNIYKLNDKKLISKWNSIAQLYMGNAN